MIIKKLELANFQVIEKFNADFEGNVYFVTGDNELGKSTILKAIGALLTGERDAVLRDGEDKGFAKMVVGDDGEEYEVKLSFTKANPRGTMTITKKNGEKTTNISALQSLFGYTDFDAVEFSRWSESAEGRRRQIKVVKSLLPEDARKRIDEIDADVQATKDARKDVNSTIKTYETLIEQMQAPEDIDQYNERIDITRLLDEQSQNAMLVAKAKSVSEAKEQRERQLAEIPARAESLKDEYNSRVEECEQKLLDADREYKAACERARFERERKIAEINEEKKDLMQGLSVSLNELDKERADYEMRRNNATEWLRKYEESKAESTDIAARLKEAEEHNRLFEIAKKYRDIKSRLDAVVSEHGVMEQKLASLAEERANLIEKSRLPIDGLTFTEEGLELNGTPFIPGRVSDSQIMEVAAKLIIASNPKVNVFRIARGESLGEKRLQAIIDIAKRNGFQGFIEEVKRGQEELIVEEYNEKA